MPAGTPFSPSICVSLKTTFGHVLEEHGSEGTPPSELVPGDLDIVPERHRLAFRQNGSIDEIALDRDSASDDPELGARVDVQTRATAVHRPAVVFDQVVR